MKAVGVICIVVFCSYFVIGGVLTHFGIFDSTIYTLTTTVIGGVAGVIGLGSLIKRPAVTAQDVRQVQSELMTDLAKSVQEVEEYEKRISTNKEELDRLQQERAQIELLVRQASLKVFLEERLKNIASEIEKRVTLDDRLHALMKEYFDVRSQVEKVKGEIDRSGKADQVASILERITYRRDAPASAALTITELMFESVSSIARLMLRKL